MSNCYDHDLKMNMLRDKPTETLTSVRKELEYNKLKLTNWFYEQLKLYEYAEDNIETWYKDYRGFDE